jgi:hypothetical protein
MMLKTRAALALALPALAFAGCGGDSDKGSSDEDQITEIINAVGADPTAICDHVDADTLEQLGGKDGCVRAGEESGDRGSEVTIEEISVDGERATARISDDDGPTTVVFAKQDGDWKIQPGS